MNVVTTVTTFRILATTFQLLLNLDWYYINTITTSQILIRRDFTPVRLLLHDECFSVKARLHLKHGASGVASTVLSRASEIGSKWSYTLLLISEAQLSSSME